MLCCSVYVCRFAFLCSLLSFLSSLLTCESSIQSVAARLLSFTEKWLAVAPIYKLPRTVCQCESEDH